MNRIYRLVFNAQGGQWQAVAENARAGGRSARRALTLLAALCLASGPALAAGGEGGVPPSSSVLHGGNGGSETGAAGTVTGGGGGYNDDVDQAWGGTGGSATLTGASDGDAGDNGTWAPGTPGAGGLAGTALAPDGGAGESFTTYGEHGYGGGGGGGWLGGTGALGGNTGALAGGAGGAGGSGIWGAGGGGGGGFGLVLDAATADFDNSGSISGGAGGRGGDAFSQAGGGGGGGTGAHLGQTGTFLNSGSVSGGAGGRGGDGGAVDGYSANGPSGGGGGAGGAGVTLVSGALRNEGGSITGGAGGDGGHGAPGGPDSPDQDTKPAGDVSLGMPGGAGSGGHGVQALGSGLQLFSSGSVTGGAGGVGGTDANGGPAGAAGAGGVGALLTGDGNTLVNAGQIAGGLGGDGAQAAAVLINGNGNTLELQAGYGFTGAVQATGTANALALGGSADANFDVSAIGGAFQGFSEFRKTGASIWTLAGSTPTVTSWAVNEGTLRAGAANVLGAASAPTVAAGATLDLAGFDQTVAGLTNAGMVSLAGAAPSSTLTVTGPWVGQGGTLALSTVLGDDASATDRLLLSGAAAVASGSTTVQVSNVGGLGALTTGNGIELIGTEGGGRIDGQAFTLAGGHVDAGAYEYRLYTTEAGGWLRSTLTDGDDEGGGAEVPTYRAEVPLLAALPEQLRQANLAMLGNLHQRIGDDTGRAPGQSSRQAWARLVSVDRDIHQSGVISPHSQGRLNGFQAGTDLWATPDWKTGVYVGQLEGQMRTSGFARGVQNAEVGGNDLRNQYVGAYFTWANARGLYADAVLQGGRHRYTVQPSLAWASTGKGSSLLASLEVGQSIPMGANWALEPQLQLIHQRLSLDDVALSGLTTVGLDTDNGWVARAGLRLKGEMRVGVGRLQPYARVNLYKRSRGHDVARFIGPAGWTDISTRTGGTSVEAAAGATWAITPAVSLYGEFGALWGEGGPARVDAGLSGALGLKVRW